MASSSTPFDSISPIERAADLLITDPGTLAVKHVWCAGRRVS